VNSTTVGASLNRAADYLIQNIDPDTGLIPETPGSSTYWLYSDNYLAALALQRYGQSNATIASSAVVVSGSLTADLLLGKMDNAENQYLVLNTSAPCQFHSAQSYTVETPDGVPVKAVLNNGTRLLSESQYADIAFLNAICLYRQGDHAGALAAYDVGRSMFDGQGLNDSIFSQPGPNQGRYQTFKLALYIYASGLLKQSFPQSALSILISMQDSGGGFYTGYDAGLSHEGTLTNTETTSLAILALDATFRG